MPFTVWSAFNDFRQNMVDLPTDTTDKARVSRDYLFDQITRLAYNNTDFPRLYNGNRSFVPFGSFARKTKVRPLDDIDVLVLMNGYGTYEYQLTIGSSCRLGISEPSSHLLQFVDETGYVNSTRVINRIKLHLFSISNYQKADLKKNMQAVVLNLKSYPWVFDIVPAVPMGNNGVINYYLIPDGYGNWIRTDPRLDARNITAVNSKHNGKFLGLMRLLKYWNNRAYYKPRLGSYYFETLVIKVFSSLWAEITDYPNAIRYFFEQCPTYLMTSCPDPKNLGGNLDANVTRDVKIKIRDFMIQQLQVADFALYYEKYSRHREAIAEWRKIFGSDFPIYG